MADQRVLSFLFAGIFWGCVLGLQRPAPRYSQQLMPDTSFTCRHKIIGSYYADPETDCQLFHVCVSVAGSVQDYRFLCPNDTAFDQESQTCADWYDVDCEAATLYYASDNFDLYRLGSGLESLHYDSVRNEVEPLDHLQRSESSDAVRSSGNSLTRASPSPSSNSYDNKDLLRGSSSSNFFNNRNNGKEDDYESEKVYREPVVEQRRKSGVRKVARKQQFNGGSNANNILQTTAAPPSTYQNQNANFNRNQNRNGNGNGNGNFNQRQSTENYPSTTTTPRPFVNSQKVSTPVSTYRPISTNFYQTNNNFNGQQTGFTDFSSNKFGTTSQQNYPSTASDQTVSTTARSTADYTANKVKRPVDQSSQAFGNQYNSQSNQFTTQPTIPKQSTSFQQSGDHTSFHTKSYNTIQRTASTTNAFQTTTPVDATSYDNFRATASRSGDFSAVSKAAVSTTRQQEFQSQTTPRFSNNFAGSSYIPTTYSPVTKNLPASNSQATSRGNEQYSSGATYESSRTTNGANGQFRDESTQQASQAYSSSSRQSYDTTRANFNGNDNNGQYRETATKTPKKSSQFNSYNAPKSNFEESTRSFDNFDSSRAVSSSSGFSPASVNKLAESSATLRPTTSVPRRTVYNSPVSQRVSSAATNYETQTTPVPRTGSFVSATPRPFSTTARPTQQQAINTAEPKTAKKNDYDYAYYDNGGTLEYDGIDLERVADSREPAKISRN